MRTLLRSTFAVVLLAAGSCLDFTRPVAGILGVSGTYQLRQVNGTAMPYVIGATILDSGSFEVRALDTVVMRETYRTPGGVGQSATVVTRVGYYKLDKAESGTFYGINISPLPDLPSPVFTAEGNSVSSFAAEGLIPPARVYTR